MHTIYNSMTNPDYKGPKMDAKFQRHLYFYVTNNITDLPAGFVSAVINKIETQRPVHAALFLPHSSIQNVERPANMFFYLNDSLRENPRGYKTMDEAIQKDLRVMGILSDPVAYDLYAKKYNSTGNDKTKFFSTPQHALQALMQYYASA